MNYAADGIANFLQRIELFPVLLFTATEVIFEYEQFNGGSNSIDCSNTIAYTIYGIYTVNGMWQILEHKRLDRRCRTLPPEVLRRYEKWKDVVSISGPAGLTAIRGFNDEALSGQLKGHRSSRLGLKFRLIYKVEAKEVLVQVLDLTPHDYRKK